MNAEDIMRRLITAFIVVGAVIPAVAFAAPVANTGGVKAPVVNTKKQCQSNACHKRVALKKKARIRSFCDSTKCKRRVAIKQNEARKRAFIAPYKGWLANTRACESGGNYRANTGNGFYGAYQFMVGTWQSVGGSGLPSDASPLEQDYRAVILLLRSGAGQWPVCGH